VQSAKCNEENGGFELVKKRQGQCVRSLFFSKFAEKDVNQLTENLWEKEIKKQEKARLSLVLLV
jgi:hypothetical protein